LKSLNKKEYTKILKKKFKEREKRLKKDVSRAPPMA